jgi:hypothetical protein
MGQLIRRPLARIGLDALDKFRELDRATPRRPTRGSHLDCGDRTVLLAEVPEMTSGDKWIGAAGVVVREFPGTSTVRKDFFQLEEPLVLADLIGSCLAAVFLKVVQQANEGPSLRDCFRV